MANHTYDMIMGGKSDNNIRFSDFHNLILDLGFTFAVLYSDKDSRPNTPVNIQIGVLVIKEFMGLSDEDMLTALMFDIRFQMPLL